MNELMELSKSEQKVAAKVLSKSGYSTRRLEQLLGIEHTTAWRATHEATPTELQQFEADFTQAISEMKKQGISLAQKRLLELIPKERRIDQVVKAAEYMEGKINTPSVVQNFTLTRGENEN